MGCTPPPVALCGAIAPELTKSSCHLGWSQFHYRCPHGGSVSARGPLFRMSSVSKGAAIERRGNAIMAGIGYNLVASAIRTPIYKGGNVIGSNATDLAQGSIDRIYTKQGRRTLFVQYTTMNGIPERRKKLRVAGDLFDPEFHEVVIAAWESPPPGKPGKFRLYRLEDDYLRGGEWCLDSHTGDLPWYLPPPPKQEKLV